MACCVYANLLQTGMGVEKDGAEALRWLCKAAELGDVKSAQSVMKAVRDGRLSLASDMMGALETAASAGDGQALNELAQRYENGLGTGQRDLCKAALWCERGIAAGNETADDRLAGIYASKDWAERDGLTPSAPYGKAAGEGCAFALLHLAEAHLEGSGVERDKAKAAQLFVKAGNAGSGMGFYRATCLYRKGDGVRKDLPWATSLLQKGAKLKCAEAQHALGCAYRDGVGVTKDPARAVELLFDAAKQGNVAALSAAAYLVEEYHSPDAARENAELAAQQGDHAAKLLIAQKILVGSAYEADQQDARRRFEELAAAGGELAGYANLFLGVIWLKGFGVTADLARGRELLALAAEQGCPAAAQILDDLWEAESEDIKERWDGFVSRHLDDVELLNSCRDTFHRHETPSVEGGWSKLASELAKEHPDHTTYELLLGRVYEIGENRHDARERKGMLYKYAYDQIMKQRLLDWHHGNRYDADEPTSDDVMKYLRSKGLLE